MLKEKDSPNKCVPEIWAECGIFHAKRRDHASGSHPMPPADNQDRDGAIVASTHNLHQITISSRGRGNLNGQCIHTGPVRPLRQMNRRWEMVRPLFLAKIFQKRQLLRERFGDVKDLDGSTGSGSQKKNTRVTIANEDFDVENAPVKGSQFTDEADFVRWARGEHADGPVAVSGGENLPAVILDRIGEVHDASVRGRWAIYQTTVYGPRDTESIGRTWRRFPTRYRRRISSTPTECVRRLSRSSCWTWWTTSRRAPEIWGENEYLRHRINQSIEQSIDQSINQRINRSIAQ